MNKIVRFLARLTLTRGLVPLEATFRRIWPLQALQDPAGRLIAVNEAGDFRALAAFNESIGAGDWVRIAPFGEFPNEVGLQIFDKPAADSIVTAFNSVAAKAATLFRGLPIYEGHPDEPAWLRANPGYKRVAVGRVKEVQTRDDGLYGRVAFNELGNQLVRGDAPAYESQSPRWALHRTTHNGKPAVRPFDLISLGLTNHANIPGTQLGLNERGEETFSPDMKSKIIALLAALGRPVANADTVTDEQLSTAVNEAVPVATAAITASNELTTLKPALTKAQADLVTAVNEKTTLTTQLLSERKARAEAIVTIAVNEGRITQAQRAEWLGRFTATNADFAAVETDLGKVKKAINTQSRVAGLGARKPEEIATISRITAINEAVTAKEKASGLPRNEAYKAVQTEQPALFTTTGAE